MKKIIKNFIYERGFSLVQVLIAAAMLAGLSMVSVNLIQNANNGQNNVQSNVDLLELRSLVIDLLEDPDACRVSLAGDSISGYPYTNFKKTAVDFEGVLVDKSIDFKINDEGVEDIELFRVSSDKQNRAQKLFSKKNPALGIDKGTFGKIDIDQIKLVFNSLPIRDFPDDSKFINENAQLVFIMNKHVGKNKRKIIEVFDLYVSGETNGGRSIVTSCKRKMERQAFLCWNILGEVGPFNEQGRNIPDVRITAYDSSGGQPMIIADDVGCSGQSPKCLVDKGLWTGACNRADTSGLKSILKRSNGVYCNRDGSPQGISYCGKSGVDASRAYYDCNPLIQSDGTREQNIYNFGRDNSKVINQLEAEQKCMSVF